MLLMLLFFVVLPIAEVAILLWFGSWLGPLPAFLLVLTTGVIGAAMARREGVAVLQRIASAASQGVPPGEQLVEAGLVAAGGLLLVTPGILTDLAGFAMILPPTRRVLAPAALRALHRAFPTSTVVIGSQGVFTTGPGPAARGRPGPAPGSPSRPTPFDHPVAEPGREQP
ncbi:MAG: FxsA family protein [Alphaproteobacteria bacterium]|nr:FxsA family protein [Alphaproteobacteria bacterium]